MSAGTTLDQATPPELAACPHLFLAFDGNHPTLPTFRHPLAGVDAVWVGRGRQREIVYEPDSRRLFLRFPDPWMSSDHARVEVCRQGMALRDPGSKNGSYLNGVRRAQAVLTDGDILRFGRTFFVYRAAHPAVVGEVGEVVADLDAPAGFATTLVPLSKSLVAFAGLALSDEPLLLAGELGTGRRLLARSVHALSLRTGKFEMVRCAGVSGSELERKLFGGDHPAARAATGGTLLLEDIDAVPAGFEDVLARLVGDQGLDCRLIATTLRAPAELAERGGLGTGLVAVLSRNALVLPPLRQRREDLGLLVARMLRGYENAAAVKFSADATQAMLRYPWPRNMTELESCIGTALALRQSHIVEMEHLPPELFGEFPVRNKAGGDTIDTVDLSEQDLRRTEIIAELRRAGGQRLGSDAAMLSETREQFQRWLARAKLHFGDS